MSPRTVRGLLVITLIAAACSASPTDIEAYGDAWTEAWSEADPYDIARFYDVDAVISWPQADYQLDNPAGFSWVGADLFGASGIVEWIPAHVAARERRVEFIGIDDETATVVVVVPDVGSALWHNLTIAGDRITQEFVIGWRDSHKPRGEPDPRLAWVDDLAGEFVVALPGDAAIATIVSGDRTGPAIFTSPGPEPVAAGILIESDGCRTAVGFAFQDRTIVNQATWQDTRCVDEGTDGWWGQLALPGPIDDRETTTVAIAGAAIEVSAWTQEAENLLSWGYERFDDAGLVAPNVRSVGFAPNEACSGVAGVAVDNADGSGDFVLCTNAHQICLPDRAECSSFTTASKLGLLHEMAHVWLLANLEEEPKSAFVELVGLNTWQSGSVPWHERGAENAAEILAWGLMDEDIGLVRIGDPPCRLAAEGFELLTGTVPIRSCTG